MLNSDQNLQNFLQQKICSDFNDKILWFDNQLMKNNSNDLNSNAI